MKKILKKNHIQNKHQNCGKVEEEKIKEKLINILNFNIYNLCTNTGDYHLLRDESEDQPDFSYKYPNEEIKTLFKDM